MYNYSQRPLPLKLSVIIEYPSSCTGGLTGQIPAMVVEAQYILILGFLLLTGSSIGGPNADFDAR